MLLLLLLEWILLWRIERDNWSLFQLCLTLSGCSWILTGLLLDPIGLLVFLRMVMSLFLEQFQTHPLDQIQYLLPIVMFQSSHDGQWRATLIVPYICGPGAGTEERFDDTLVCTGVACVMNGKVSKTIPLSRGIRGCS